MKTKHTIRYSLVHQAPPPKKRLAGPSTSQIQLDIQAMNPGECMQVRPCAVKKQKSLAVHVNKAKKVNGKKYTTRAVEGGFDIYCVA